MKENKRDGDTLRGNDWCLGCHPYTSKARTVFAMAHPALALNGRRCSGRAVGECKGSACPVAAKRGETKTKSIRVFLMCSQKFHTPSQPANQTTIHKITPEKPTGSSILQEDGGPAGALGGAGGWTLSRVFSRRPHSPREGREGHFPILPNKRSDPPRNEPPGRPLGGCGHTLKNNS